MRYGSVLKTMLALIWIILSGCPAHHSQPTTKEKITPKHFRSNYHLVQTDECEPIEVADDLVKKVDNFMVIFDPSASMTETYIASADCIVCHAQYKETEFANQHVANYGGQKIAKQDGYLSSKCIECHQDNLYTKFKFAKKIVYCFNQTIPDLELISAIRTFGSPVYTSRNYGPESYSKEEFGHALRKIIDVDGASPIDHALLAAKKDWFAKEGKIAVIIISDGKDMNESAVLAAEELKAAYGENICIYTIQIGNDPAGKVLLERIASAGQCGLTVNADTLLNQEDMNDFVREVFLSKRPPKKADSDGDGVTDDKDICPDTPPGLKVDENGCWDLVILGDVLFDFDKYNLKPEGHAILDQVVEMLNKHSFLNLKLSGHTDNFGSMEYNIRLSKKRAQAGMNYLLEKGISSERLSISWHSFSIPRAGNETPEGRALNRRIEFKFNKYEKTDPIYQKKLQ
jgi:OOP family OmpA-OmpF porin